MYLKIFPPLIMYVGDLRMHSCVANISFFDYVFEDFSFFEYVFENFPFLNMYFEIFSNVSIQMLTLVPLLGFFAGIFFFETPQLCTAVASMTGSI